MSTAASTLVNKVWNYCNLLRDDGVSYGDYVEQLTYLLFLKMDYERTRPPYKRKSQVPPDYNWASLIELDGLPLERHYRNTLENLGKEPGILGPEIIAEDALPLLHLVAFFIDYGDARFLADPEPCPPSPPYRRPHRQGAMERAFGRRQGRHLRGPAGKERSGHQERRRPVFHAPRFDRLQHVRSLLKINGRAAIVVPDNVLFEGGAGEAIRKRLLHDCDVHTLLRLPTGIFYAQGVKANVLFFDRKPASEKPWTRTLWIYDLRTNQHFTLKTKTLARADLDDFVRCYNPANRHERAETERFRRFSYEDLLKRDKANLDIFWLRDESLGDSSDLPDPAVLAAEIVEDLQAALDQFAQIAADLAAGNGAGPTKDPNGK